MVPSKTRNRHGFTLLEVLTVVVLIAIFFLVAISALSDHSTVRHIAAGDILASHIRYVQMRSMDTSIHWGIELQNNAYWMYRSDDIVRKWPFPGEAADAIQIDTDISIVPSSFQLHFDDWGRPIVNGSEDQLSLTLTLAGQPVRNLLIIANTGFVQWQP
jgi:prepilin-type N-terminal cleavage/methylation domain-containing protein